MTGGVPGPPDGAPATQAFLQFLLQNPTGLNIETAINRSPLVTLLRNTLLGSACDTRFRSISGCSRLSQLAICSGDHFKRSFLDIQWHKGALNESLQDLGRFAQSQAR